MPKIQCPDTMMGARSDAVTSCYLPSGNRGVVCPPKKLGAGASGRAGSSARSPPTHNMRRAMGYARQRMKHLLDAAERTPVLTRSDGAFFNHFHSVLGKTDGTWTPSSPNEYDESTAAICQIFATQEMNRRDMSTESSAREEIAPEAKDWKGPQCPRQPRCNGLEVYRRHDGTCNNPEHNRWGSAGTPHSRLLPPRYQDDVWEPRRSVNGDPLPGARFLSSSMFPDRDVPHRYASLLVMLYGQVLSHDLLLTPSIQRANGSGVQCCAPGASAVLRPDERHFACMPIEIPADDPFYSQFGKRCMNMARTQLGLRDDCAMGPASQLNTVTHLLDASVAYGSSDNISASLREFRGGRLRTHREGGRELPPLTSDRDTCGAVSKPDSCFLTGDIRGNQMIGLTVVAALLVRQHNALADALAVINPHWGDERLYQEARRIVVGQLQHLTYNEFLPVVIGHEAMTDFELWPLHRGYSMDFDPSVEASTTLEFATAAYRFGHSSVEGIIKLLHSGWGLERILLTDLTLDSSRLHHPPFADEFLQTVTREPMQNIDPFVSKALTNFLFNGDQPFGVDLIAINLQRGRDHGLPTYNDMRVLQGLPPVVMFNDFADRIPQAGVAMLEKMYASPEDVDLFVGGLLELPAHNAVVGPTFQGIIADQFSRLKKGDRFFYEFGGFPNSFTPGQLQEIRKTRMARILCDINDGLSLNEVSPFPFLVPRVRGNQRVKCSLLQLPRINLMHWKE